MRSLALGIVALVVLANGYSGLFGDYRGDVWRTVNPLLIGSSSVAAVALWRRGSAAGRAGAVVSVALGALVFANGYFVNNEVLWQGSVPSMLSSAIAAPPLLVASVSMTSDRIKSTSCPLLKVRPW